MAEEKRSDFDKYGRLEDYHWVTYEKNPYYRARCKAVLEYVKEGSNVLDLGCGDGVYMAQVARRARFVVGVDIQKTGLRIARDKFRELGIGNADLVWSDFKDATSRLSGKFQVVYAMDVIEHLDVPSVLLVLADQAMAPGGIFLLGTPLFVEERMVSRYHVKEYTLLELRKLVSGMFDIAKERLLADKMKDGRIIDRFAFIELRKRNGK